MRYVMRALLGGMVVTAIGFLAGCSSDDSGSAERIEVRAMEFSFDPGGVTLSAGKQYRLVFENGGTVLHDWTVDRIPVSGVVEKASAGHDMAGMGGMMGSGDQLHVAVSAGKTGELTFTPTQPGEYEYWCTVIGHRELGMQGRLVVQG